MSHTVDGQTTSYTWDVAASLPVVLQDNTYTYVYGLDLISATDASGNQNYYLHNGQGSVANIVDYNGNEKARYLYDAFGNTRYTLELTPNVWLYAGEQQDDGTGFYYLRARYYDPFLGRFITRARWARGTGTRTPSTTPSTWRTRAGCPSRVGSRTISESTWTSPSSRAR